MIGIICAMDIEAEKLVVAIESARVEKVGHLSFTLGRLCGQDVAIAMAGIGKVNAAMCAQTMILKYAPELIINSGVAGSLSPRLDIGDIAVGTGVVQHDFDTTAIGDPPAYIPDLNGDTFPCDAEAAEAILRAAEKAGVKAVPAKLASGDQFVSDAAVKARLVNLFGAEACEMESAAIAQVCFFNGVKCAVIRAISDSTDGEHYMEYSQFKLIAADRSARVVLAFLEAME